MPSKPSMWPDALTQAFRAQGLLDAALWAHWFYGSSPHQGLGPWECCEQMTKEQ